MTPNSAESRAVLIGTHSGCETLGLGLEDLPSVERNLSELQRLMTDDTVWALPSSHCMYIPQPRSVQEVLAQVERAATEATDTLLVYYAGHGLLVGREEDLYLAIPGVKWEDECVRYEALRTRIRESGARARRTIVILDCCFSGRALSGEMGTRQSAPPQTTIERTVATKAEIEGACVLTASASTRKALAPEGDEYTAFTGELISVLRNGIPGGGEFLDMATIYSEIAVRLARRPGVPEPQFGTRGLGGEIIVGRNYSHFPLDTSQVNSTLKGYHPHGGDLPPVVGTYKDIEIRSERVLLEFLRMRRGEDSNE